MQVTSSQPGASSAAGTNPVEEMRHLHLLLKAGAVGVCGVGALALLATAIHGIASGILPFIFCLSCTAFLIASGRDMLVVLRQAEPLLVEGKKTPEEDFVHVGGETTGRETPQEIDPPATTDQRVEKTWILHTLLSGIDSSKKDDLGEV